MERRDERSSTRSSRRVAAVGHICLDLTPEFHGVDGLTGTQDLTDIMRPGKLNRVGPLNISTGGSVSNTGIALIRLGMETVLLGMVGDDMLGRSVVEVYEEYVEDASYLVHPGLTTSYTVVISPPDTDRIFLHHTGGNDLFTSESVDFGLIGDADLFHFGYPTLMRKTYENGGTELLKIMRKARAMGMTTSLDLAMPDPSSPAMKENWDHILGTVLPLTDLFLPSLEESLLLLEPELYLEYRDFTGDETRSETPRMARVLLDRFIGMGVAVAGVKCGDMGYAVRTADRGRIRSMGRARPADISGFADRQIWAPAYRPQAFRSTTGAGDASIAGFIAAFLRGFPLEICTCSACAVGAQNITETDATSGVRPLDEAIAMVESDAERIPVTLGEEYSYDEEARVYRRGVL